LAANFASSSSCSIFFTTSPSYFPHKRNQQTRTKKCKWTYAWHLKGTAWWPK
jgi:hypothetical protein